MVSSDNDLSPGQWQAIIWTSAGILLMRLFGTNFSEILIGNQTFSFKKMHLKMLSVKWHPFCLSLNVLTDWGPNREANILQMPIFLSLGRKWFYFDGDKLHFVPIGLSQNKSVRVQIMTRHQAGAKPLPKPMMAQLSGAYLLHQAFNC